MLSLRGSGLGLILFRLGEFVLLRQIFLLDVEGMTEG